MAVFLEVHLLQSTPPSNMNRDQNGAPKTAYFGGMERLRVSSQCWKRAMRQHYKDTLPDDHKTYRDRAWAKELAKRLNQKGFDGDLKVDESSTSAVLPVSLRVAWMLLSALGVKPNKGNYEAGIVDTLLFLGETEIRQMLKLAESHKELLIRVAQNPPKVEKKSKGTAKKPKAQDTDETPVEDKVPEVSYQLPGTPINGGLGGSYQNSPLEKLVSEAEFKALKSLCDGIQGVLYDKKKSHIQSVPGDVALFGRMLASLPVASVDAAVSVAHAISANTIKREFDYWTAAGDFEKADSDQGKGGEHIGDRPFSSGVFYRYSCLDLAQLVENMGEKFKNDLGLIVEHYLDAFLYSRPTGYSKQFGHDTVPFAGMFVIRHSQPISLVQAFETPIKPKPDESISQKSWQKAVQHWNEIQQAHGKRLPVEAVHVFSEASFAEVSDDKKSSIDKLSKELPDRAIINLLKLKAKNKQESPNPQSSNPLEEQKEDTQQKVFLHVDFSDAIEAAVADLLKHREG
ncbi:MAG: type I-E CRISPR-associated protein Cas7/Cse4/CasC [Cyanobacteriota bacterium]|nr:type I-E CRISPR-associated protein Cas7/Cse4/CasC [Cyanobacteriota bacterium]